MIIILFIGSRYVMCLKRSTAFCVQQGGRVVIQVVNVLEVALWGQGGKSLPLSEFSIFGRFWVQEVFIYGNDLKEIIF